MAAAHQQRRWGLKRPQACGQWAHATDGWRRTQARVCDLGCDPGLDGKTARRFSSRAPPSHPTQRTLGARHATSTLASVAGRTAAEPFTATSQLRPVSELYHETGCWPPRLVDKRAASLRRWDWARAALPCLRRRLEAGSRSAGSSSRDGRQVVCVCRSGVFPRGTPCLLGTMADFCLDVSGRAAVWSPTIPTACEESYLFNQWVCVVVASYLSKRRSAGCLCPTLPLVWSHICNMIFSFSSWNRLL